MANLSEDIQCAGSDTRPHMFDRTDFASWQQCIRMYCRGKENEVNIFKSIDEGPFQMGTVREPLAKGTEGAPHLGPERPRVYSDLSPKEKDRYNAKIRATNMLLQGLPKDIYTLINHHTDAKGIRDNHKGETIQDYYVWFAKLINDIRNIKMTMSRMQLNSKFVNNMLPEWGRFVIVVKLNRGLRDSNYDQLSGDQSTCKGTAGYGGVQNRVGNANPGQARQVKCYNYNDNTSDEDVDEQPVQDLALNVDNMFQADDCDAFDYDVDEALAAQTMFMANLSSADHVNDEAGPSYDSDILFKVHDHDHYQDAVFCKGQRDASCTNNVSSIPNDAYMIIYNDMYEPHAQSVSKTSRNTVVENLLTTELATYKEQVELYERRVSYWLQEPLMPYPCKASSACSIYWHEIIKDNHVSGIVHNTEDTLDIAEINRRKMNDKMKDPECVNHKSSGSLDFEVLIVGYEHVVMNCGSAGNRYLHSPLMFPVIKQLEIKWWDEYGFVIHPGVVGLTCKSMRIDL
nr:hypothetical protein [Tanacetum cinerariifolium]